MKQFTMESKALNYFHSLTQSRHMTNYFHSCSFKRILMSKSFPIHSYLTHFYWVTLSEMMLLANFSLLSLSLLFFGWTNLPGWKLALQFDQPFSLQYFHAWLSYCIWMQTQDFLSPESFLHWILQFISWFVFIYVCLDHAY